MDSSRPLGLNVLKLTGFYFEAPGAFPSQDVANRIYNTLFENTTEGRSTDIEGAKKHVANQIHILFRICLRHIQLYNEAQGGRQFWDAVSNDWPGNLNSNDAETLVDVFVNARRKHKDRDGSVTKLTKIVDQWMNASQTWPPPHFNTYECGLLKDPKVIDDLKEPMPEPLPPIATSVSSPVDVKKFLCRAALENLSAHSTLAIHLAPIAFIDSQERTQWHNDTGSFAKTYGTAEEFISYAKDCFANRQKELVAGVFNHWLGTTHQVHGAFAVDSTGRTRAEFWVQSCARRSIIIVLQKVDNERIDAKLFDPTIILAKRQGRHPPMTLTMQSHVWKNDFHDRIQQAFPGGDSWHGWKVSNPMSLRRFPLEDEVQISCAFVWALAAGDLEIDRA